VIDLSFSIFGNTPVSKKRFKNPEMCSDRRLAHFFKTAVEMSLASPFSYSFNMISQFLSLSRGCRKIEFSILLFDWK
jgi:hypothetical protein